MSTATAKYTFTEMIEFISARLNLDNAILRRLNAGRLFTVAAFGYGEEECRLHIFLGQGVTGQCALLGETICINDLSTYQGEYLAGIREARSELCIPLIGDQGMVVGTLNLESTIPCNFTEEKRDLLEKMARRIRLD